MLVPLPIKEGMQKSFNSSISLVSLSTFHPPHPPVHCLFKPVSFVFSFWIFFIF